jgi:hypothetical protein
MWVRTGTSSYDLGFHELIKSVFLQILGHLTLRHLSDPVPSWNRKGKSDLQISPFLGALGMSAVLPDLNL